MPATGPEQVVSSAARQAAESPRWVNAAARIGYAAKGVVYGLVGVLAFKAAIGAGGQTEGTKGVIREIGQQPFGQALLIATAVGLAGYTIWRLIAAVTDPDHHGSDAKGMLYRVGYVVSGLTYGALCYYAIALATGDGGDSGSGGPKGMTAELMSHAWGRWLVGLAGVVLIGVAVAHFVRAAKASFMKRYKQEKMSRTEVTWARRLGRFGIASRGVTFAMIGFFVLLAAWTADPSRAKGLEGALDTLARQPYGPWLLGVVGAGFVAYGTYCVSRMAYRRFQEP